MQGYEVKKFNLPNRGEVITTLKGSELKPGMYVYVLLAVGEEIDTKKMILTD